MPEGPATIHIQTRLLEHSKARRPRPVVRCEIIAPDGRTVATTRKSARLGARPPGRTRSKPPRSRHPACGRRKRPAFTGWSPPWSPSGAVRRPHRDRVRHSHRGVRCEQGISAERQALRPQGHLQSPGPRGRRRGAARPPAVFPRREAEGDGLQRLSHVAQSAHAGVAGGLRPPRHAGHGRKPAAGQRPRRTSSAWRAWSGATATIPASASGRWPTRNSRCRPRRPAGASPRRCRRWSSDSTRPAP